MSAEEIDLKGCLSLITSSLIRVAYANTSCLKSLCNKVETDMNKWTQPIIYFYTCSITESFTSPAPHLLDLLVQPPITTFLAINARHAGSPEFSSWGHEYSVQPPFHASSSCLPVSLGYVQTVASCSSRPVHDLAPQQPPPLLKSLEIGLNKIA